MPSRIYIAVREMFCVCRKFMKFLDGTDLRADWVALVTHAAHCAADAKTFLKFNDESKVVKLLAHCPESVRVRTM